VLPVAAQVAVDDLLGRLDRVVPGRVEGFYVVGSACLGAFRVGRSDLDFVAIVDGELGRGDLARVRAVHLGRWGSALVRDVAMRRRWPLVCNGVYLSSGDLSRSSLEVTPLAGHIAGRFKVAERDGLDVNPVTWHTLAGHGIAVRGPERDRLRVHLDDAQLRAWTLGNLNSYWRRWSRRAQRNAAAIGRALPRRFAAGGVLGAPRLYYTITTGTIASKEAAGFYALETFDPRWHALIEDALAFWRGERALDPYRYHPSRRNREAAAFVDSVIEAANRR
jgi:Domain of unknown function (DUF4111)